LIDLSWDPVQLLKARTALTHLEAENFIRPELPGYIESVLTVADVYPTQFKGAHYERTGKLKASWETSVVGLDARIKNIAPYAGWVLLRNPRHKIGTKRAMRMDWKVEKGNAWPLVNLLMIDKMADWIVYMEHKAFRLWER
jgi:hypothetical protein